MRTGISNQRRIFKGLGFLLIAWLAVVTLFSIQLNIISGFPVTQALRLAVPLWLIWLILAPATIFIALRFPFGNGRNTFHAGILIAVCIVFVMASQALTRNFMSRRGGIMIPTGPPPWIRMATVEEALNNSTVGDQTQSSKSRVGLPLNISAARSTFDVLIFWTLVSACQAYAWIGRAREQEKQALKAEANATQAQLQALQSQLNPHFLFNSLNAITALVHTNPSVADEMLTDLSRLLRATLDSESRQTITLSEELQLLDCYLEIESTRFGNRLNIVRKFDPSTMEVRVPTFILQPLVENAIRHGIEQCTSDGTIQIITALHNDRLILTIKDSGPGFDINKNHQQLGGIGISNTRQRLIHLYGDCAKLSITNGKTDGCQVMLDLPLKIPQNKPLSQL